MNVNLSQKEQMLLKDLKEHEEICIKKYNNYANQAQCPQLKQLFTTHAQQEQQHLNTLNQIETGQVPHMGQQNQQQSQQNQSQQSNVQGSQSGGMKNQDDATLCSDVLMTEKHVSNTYDTAIFEFRDKNIRQALNHIQKEEQEHGEDIFNYMQNNGMYNIQ